MKKRLIIILIITLIGVLSIKLISKQFTNTDTIICRISNIVNRNNTIDLKVIGIDIKEVDITWYPEMTDTNVIFKCGRRVGTIGYDYGPNRFDIHLQDDLEFKVGHFKTNNWHSHRYEIYIKKDSSSYKVKFIADGPDFEWIEQSFDSNGILNGQIISFYENGNKSYKGNYINGLKQDSFIYYHRNGQIRVINEFLNDTLHGYTTNNDKDGNLMSKIKYKNGQKLEVFK